MTPFARFLIVMVFAAPVAYLAASYYNGEDGIQNLKELLGIGSGDKREAPAAPDRPAAEPDTATLDLQNLQEAYDQLKQENAELKESLRRQELEIQELKREIRLLKGSQGN